jgi:hypothetical protein
VEKTIGVEKMMLGLVKKIKNVKEKNSFILNVVKKPKIFLTKNEEEFRKISA